MTFVWTGLNKILDKLEHRQKKTKLFFIRPYDWNRENTNNKPHFIYYPKKLKLRWYKYPLRSAETTSLETPTIWVKAIYDCLKAEKLLEETISDFLNVDSCSYCKETIWGGTSQSYKILNGFGFDLCYKHVDLDIEKVKRKTKGKKLPPIPDFHFICLNCGEMWIDDSHNSEYSKGCPSCKTPEGNGLGCYSEISNKGDDLIHGRWENHIGLETYVAKLLLKKPKQKRLCSKYLKEK